MDYDIGNIQHIHFANNRLLPRSFDMGRVFRHSLVATAILGTVTGEGNAFLAASSSISKPETSTGQDSLPSGIGNILDKARDFVNATVAALPPLVPDKRDTVDTLGNTISAATLSTAGVIGEYLDLTQEQIDQYVTDTALLTVSSGRCTFDGANVL